MELIAKPGYVYALKSDLSVYGKNINLGVNDSPDNWTEIELESNWHDHECIYQVKISYRNLVGLIKDIPAIIQYRETLTTFEDNEFTYYYVNFFNGMDKEMLERYGAIITLKSNI